MPILSIIMPAYGVEEYISIAIDSVLSQIFEDWELIVVNDGSLDRSGEIAKMYASRDHRIQVYDKTNGGLSDARNFGIQYANGKYIHFFDSDDRITSEYYSTMIREMEATDADILISGYTVETINTKGRSSIHKQELLIPPSTSYEFANFINFINFAWNKLFRKEFLLNTNLRYEKGLKAIEDCEFMSRVVKYNPKIDYSCATGYYYRNDTRTTLSKYFDIALISLEERRIGCSVEILKFLSKDANIISEAIEICRFRTLRALLHSLFAFSSQKMLKYDFNLVKEIIHTPNLRINTKVPSCLTYQEKVLWTCLHYRLSFLVYGIYRLKETKSINMRYI